MKFCWDFKTKRLGKIEHTLSRDYFLSNFKSDFCLFERFLSLSWLESHPTLSLVEKWSRARGDLGSSKIVGRVQNLSKSIQSIQKLPDFDSSLIWTRDWRTACSEFVRNFQSFGLPGLVRGLKIFLGSGPARFDQQFQFCAS